MRNIENIAEDVLKIKKASSANVIFEIKTMLQPIVSNNIKHNEWNTQFYMDKLHFTKNTNTITKKTLGMWRQQYGSNNPGR